MLYAPDTILDYEAGLNLVLVEPEIPGNTGSIGRLCVGLDATLTLIHPLGYSLDDKQLKRAGLDYWPHLKWRDLETLDHLFELTGDTSRFYFMTTKTHRPYTSVAFKPGDFLVFGKETKGLPESLLKQFAQQTLTIPMFGPIRSHNLAVSAGVVGYEAKRQMLGGFPS